jgi:DNA-binding CsgD family transcriptional regulator
MTPNLDPDLDVAHALAEVGMPAYVLDRRGQIRWLNRSSFALIGNRVGEHFASAVAAEGRNLARAQFARKLMGGTATDYDLALLDRDGRRRRVRISSVPLRRHSEIVGVFGLACPAGSAVDGATAEEAAARPLGVTARQYETLALLADGLGTSAIASRLGVAEETARNHIRGLLRQLGVHSRLEAVVLAYRLGLLRPPRDV